MYCVKDSMTEVFPEIRQSVVISIQKPGAKKNKKNKPSIRVLLKKYNDTMELSDTKDNIPCQFNIVQRGNLPAIEYRRGMVSLYRK